MATIQVQELQKGFKKNQQVVNNFNLKIEDKEFCVLVGSSGCGKSTVLRMIAGLEQPTSGKVMMDGTEITSVPPGLRDMAMVFQNYALFSHMTVEENLSWGLKIRKTPKHQIKEMVDDVAERLEIKPLLRRKPSELSGGQRQRVALGRALIRRAKLYLMDEPLSNLDALLRVQMRTEILKLCKDLDMTVLYVTHDQTEALSMADKLVVMKDGVIQQLGKPQDVYNHPTNMFVASFIGSPKMNFFLNGELEGREFRSADLKLLIGNRPGAGRKVNLGIRPEHIYFKRFEHKRLSEAVSVPVELVQTLGSERIVSIKVGYQSVLVAADQEVKLSRGDMMDVYFDLDHVHLFSPDTGLAIANE